MDKSSQIVSDLLKETQEFNYWKEEWKEMKATITRSRKTKKDKVTIILETCSKENAELLQKEIKKAVHSWNRLLNKELSFKIMIIEPSNHNCQEAQQHQSVHQ